jgi:hypothetical protein
MARRASAVGVLCLAAALFQAPTALGFEYLTEWGGLDGPEGIDVTPAGVVYVGEYDANLVKSFTSTGTLIDDIGSFGTGDGVGDLAVNPANGDLYFTDNSGHRVVQTDADGAFIRDWGANGGDGTAGSADGEFDLPLGIAVGNGSVYVADQNNDRIQQFSLAGIFIRDWGDSGNFDTPTEVAVAPSGNLYTVENGDKVQQFTSSGGFIRAWGSSGTGSGEFEDPLGIAVESTGDVWVSDTSRVQEFTSTGAFIRKFGKNGGDGTTGSGPGEFAFAFNMAFDCRGSLYVADYDNDRVQKFGEPGAGQPPCSAGPGGPINPGSNPGAPDSSAPTARVLFDRVQHLDSLNVFLEVSENSNLVGTGTLTVPKSAKVLRFRRVRRSVLAGVGVQLRFRLTKKKTRVALRALGKRKRLKVRLKIRATDTVGNARTRTIKLKIKR